MLSREGKQTDRGAVGAEFIGYNRRRREALLLQEFPHQPNCRPSVPAGLNQEIQDFALTVHGTPEIELPPSNYDDHLVQVPAFGRSWPPTLNPPRIGPTEFQDPSSNCLIRDVETTLGKQVLNVPIAQRETAIEPDGMLDDDRWKAVTTVGYLAHPETLKHRPCRSHAVNVKMPRDEAPRAGASHARPTPDPEVVAKPKRRKFTAQYRLRILEEAESCTQPGEVGRLLRREGLYSSHLTEWRRARREGSLQGLTPSKRGRKPAERNPLSAKVHELEAKVARLEKELHTAHTILDVQGKVAGLLGFSLEHGKDC